MPEILTESFCERCGTRYTFESVAPRKTRKLGQFKTLSKGVKNWVMSDDSSLDEAMAAARGDEERAATAQQLDAFHSTFNFCMNCRQYTCGNCWNAAEGRCLTCAPNLGAEILPAPFPDAPAFEPVRLDVGAWPEADLSTTNGDVAAASNGTVPDLDVLFGGNGVHHDEANGTAADSNGVVHDEIPEIDAAFRLSFLSSEAAAPTWPADEPGPEADAFDGAADLIGLPEPELTEPEPVAAVDAAPSHDHDLAGTLAAALAVDAVVDAGTPEAGPAEVALDDVVAAAPSHPEAEPLPEDFEGRAAAMNARTAALLARFRPGESLDAELAAYEAELAAKDDPAGVSAAEVAGAAAVAAGVESLADETPVVADDTGADGHSIAAAAALAAAAAAGSRLDGSGEHDHHEDHGHEPRVAARSAAAAAATTASSEPEPGPEPAIAGEAEPEPSIAAEAEREPAVAAAASEPAPAPEPAPATAEPVREDRIEQPTWRIFAPDPQNPTAPTTLPQTPPAQPSIPVQASADPQWPSRPDIDESPSMALLANRSRSSSEAMWAASAREVADAPVGAVAAPVAGVQPCSSCGLSLSANARFCRRCGTRQG